MYIGCNLNLSNSDKFRWNKIDDLVSFDVEEVDEVFKVDEVGSATFDEVEFMFSDTSILIVDDLYIQYNSNTFNKYPMLFVICGIKS